MAGYLPGNEAESSGFRFTRLGDIAVAAFVSDLFVVLEFGTNSSGVDRIESRLVLSSITRLSGFNALKSAREYSEEKRPRAIKDVSAVDHLLRPLLARYCLCIAIEFLLEFRPLDDSFAPRDLPLSHVSPRVLFFADERKEWVAS